MNGVTQPETDEKEIERLREQQRRRRQELGRLLILARQDPGMEHGGWETFLSKLGIPIERASEWMREAEFVAEMTKSTGSLNDFIADWPLKPGIDRERHTELAKDTISLLAEYKAAKPPRKSTAPRIPLESRHIYFIQARDGGPIKIGMAFNVAKRLKELQCGHPAELCVIGTFAGDPSDESRLHSELSRYRVHGEWFSDSDEVRAAIVRETK